MRTRKVKNSEEILQNTNLIIKNPSLYKGKWKSFFNNNNPIYLEIGMGKGKFIVENALINPNINYIGIERFDSIIIRAVQKLENRLNNLIFIKDDALNLLNFFDKEIDLLYLNFSDPWPKNRHENRRLTSSIYLNIYDKILKYKEIHFKTDNRLLFEYSLKSFNENSYLIKNIYLDLHKEDVFNVKTEYEEKKSIFGPIYKVEVIKEV